MPRPFGSTSCHLRMAFDLLDSSAALCSPGSPEPPRADDPRFRELFFACTAPRNDTHTSASSAEDNALVVLVCSRFRPPVRLVLGSGLAPASGVHEARFKRTSFYLFTYLHERAGRWIEAQELQQNVLRAHCRPGASNVRWHVLQARQALGPASFCLHNDRHNRYMFALERCRATHCAGLKK